MTIALPQKSLVRTRKDLARPSNIVGVSSTATTDDGQEEYLTSNSLEYQDESDSGSEFEQDSDEDHETISNTDSEVTSHIRPSTRLKKYKSRELMVSSGASDQDELEQVMFEAAVKESRQNALQELKIDQSSRGAGSSRAAAPSPPDFDDDDLSDLSDEDIPLKAKGKGKTKGKVKATAIWDDSDVESESWEVAGEFDAPELTTKEKKALAQDEDPVKVHQRAMARKLGRKLTHASPFHIPPRIHLTFFSGREDIGCATSSAP